MKREVQAPTSIEDGLHKGVILMIEARETKEKYKYIDFTVEFEEGKRIRASYADFVSTESQLGMLLVRFGLEVTKGKELDFDVLLNRTCQFMTVKKGKYSNVVNESLKPVQ